MKIKDVAYTSYGEKVFEIVKAEYCGDFIIKINFDDGVEKSVDFKPFLQKSKHPSIKKYLDEKLFQRFELVDGNLNWNDFDLIFPLSDLYSGEIG